MKIWHNNELVDAVSLPAVGAGWLVGDGAFESLRTYSGKIFQLERHLRRLQDSLTHLVIQGPNLEDLVKGARAVVEANPVSGSGTDFGRLRVSVFSDGQWLVTHVPYHVEDRGISLTKYPEIRYSKNSISMVKSVSYAENFRALRMAKEKGFDDAVFFNEENHVVETTVANLLWMQEGRWFTSKLSSGCLPGLTRAFLVEEFGVQEGVLSESDLKHCQALAITSSLREVVAVERYEGKLYPSSKLVLPLQTSFHAWVLDKLDP